MITFEFGGSASFSVASMPFHSITRSFRWRGVRPDDVRAVSITVKPRLTANQILRLLCICGQLTQSSLPQLAKAT